MKLWPDEKMDGKATDASPIVFSPASAKLFRRLQAKIEFPLYAKTTLC